MKKIIRKKNFHEEAPANATGPAIPGTKATGPAIPGTGDDPQAFPKGEPLKKYKRRSKGEQEDQTMDIALMRRATPMMEESDKRTGDYKTGTFAGSTTFVVPSNLFHEFKQSKKKGKHWRTYIGEDGYWRHIREYAAKNPKKSIIIQDESTGAMCYARHGDYKKNIMEAPLLTYIDKKRKFNRETGRQYPEEKSGDKIARIDSEHDLHYKKSTGGSTYMVRNRKTGVIHATIFGYPKRRAGTFEINATDSTGQGPKMHKVYRKILQSGHARALVGVSHSEGGQKIWQKLSRERGVNIHGWVGGRKGKPVNLDPRDPEETHVSYDDAYDSGDAAAKDILRTKLVATMTPRKKIVRKQT